jgi:hypothetical protein
MTEQQWEKSVIENMTEDGWINDRNDEETLGFSFKQEDGACWIRDYNKKTRTFVQFMGNQLINLKTSNKNQDE